MSELSILFNELIRFETELWNAVESEMRERHGLSLTKFEPMTVIAKTPSCRVHDIAQALSLTSGGTSKLVDTLEQSGLCRRVPNPSDRRSSLLELTPEGKRTLARATKTFERTLQARIGDALPPQSRARFIASIVKLRAELATQAADHLAA